MIYAGSLRHRVTIQKPVYEQDSFGDVTPGWVNVANIWASVKFLSAREFVAANAEQSKIVARITIRHRNNIDATMRIFFRGQYYNIEGVLPDPDSGLEYLTLPVSQGVRK